MSGIPRAHAPGGEGDRLQSLRLASLGAWRGGGSSLARDRWFRRAWAASVFLHALLFAWVAWAPSEPKYRFYGSGTAVSLVGADQLPGGSARGRSGDKPEALREAARASEEAARKIALKEQEEKRRARQREAERREQERVRRIKLQEEAKERERQARLREIRERREREERWRRRYEGDQQKEAAASKTPPTQVAKRAEEPPKPRAGHPGEGGGDGQGGGSLGGGSGGVARSDLERYYGLLAERVRSHWSVPLNLSNLGDLRTTVAVDVARDGTVRNLRIETSSGNRIYDERALKAVEVAANPQFPEPPNTVRETWLLLGFRFCGTSFCR